MRAVIKTDALRAESDRRRQAARRQERPRKLYSMRVEAKAIAHRAAAAAGGGEMLLLNMHQRAAPSISSPNLTSIANYLHIPG